MAITRAQQVKQMLREGGRIGLRNGSYDEEVGVNTPDRRQTYDSPAQSFKDSVPESSYDAPTGAVDDPFGDQGRRDIFKARNTNTTGYDEETGVNTPPTGGEGDKNNNVVGGGDGSLQTLYDEGLPDSNFPGVLGFGLNFFKDFRNKGLRKNIDYFNELQARGRLQDYPPTAEGYKQYIQDRMSGKITATGNPGSATRDNDSALSLSPQKNIPDPEEEEDDDDDDQTTDVFAGIAPRFSGSIFDFDKLRREQEQQSAADGGRIGAMEGGIMDLESGRQMYFLGKLVKKATRAVKKISKSPLGKAALAFGAYKLGAPLFGKGTFFGTGFNPLKDSTGIGPMSSGLGKLLSKIGLTNFATGDLTLGGKIGLGFGIPAALSLFAEEEETQDMNMGPELTMEQLRAIRNSPYRYTAPRFEGSQYKFADGGRIGLKGGTGSKILNFFKPFGGKTKGGKQFDGLLYGSEGLGEILRLLSSSGMFAEGGYV